MALAIPALTIGLDPLFKVCYKLRVTDILQLQKARIIRNDIPETTDLMCLNGHIIQKVEIMGIIVRVDKRERFISYGVDDGTGVISCTVWKNSNNEQVISMASLPRSLQEKFAAITSHYQSSVHEGYSLGDLVQIQGRVRVHRDMNEISALDHRKIENPNVELERILDLPKFYKLYKQPVILPTKVEEHLRKMNDKENPLNETVLQDAITQYIQQYKCQLTEFTVDKLVSLPCLTQLFSSNQWYE
ncbi:CST complex subunit STN1-like [Physella acuta]|uniref:CST complex subunit STN1-like n=1 Tax=Physella acuta TaxID=109671 RepID=UPI0027DE8A12|nr:CST complex subunit STN1-like [Physella acuta]